MMIRGWWYQILTLNRIFWVDLCKVLISEPCEMLYLKSKAELLGLRWLRTSKADVQVTNTVRCSILMDHLLMRYNLMTYSSLHGAGNQDQCLPVQLFWENKIFWFKNLMLYFDSNLCVCLKKKKKGVCLVLG